MVNNRIEWVDFLKGISILWLVLYHFYVIDWLRSPVPVFFFLSGLFFSDGKSFSEFFSSKAKALLVPFLFFFILGVLSSLIKCLFQGESFVFPPLWQFATLIPADAERTNPLGVGAIWFLASLFEIYIILYLLCQVSRNKWWLLFASVILWVFSAVMMQFYGNGSLFYLIYTSGFVIYFVVANLLRDRVLFGRIPGWVLLLSIGAYSVRFIDPSNLLESSLPVGRGILQKINGMLSMMGVIGVLVWTAKKLFDYNVTNSRLCKFILFEGRNSLTILGVHLLVMGLAMLLLNRFLSVGTFYYLMLFIIIVAACNLCIVVFNCYIPFFVNHKRKKQEN